MMKACSLEITYRVFAESNLVTVVSSVSGLGDIEPPNGRQSVAWSL